MNEERNNQPQAAEPSLSEIIMNSNSCFEEKVGEQVEIYN